jgi:hypothetical protein
MATKRELFEQLQLVLSRDCFSFDDESSSIRVTIPLTSSDIDDFEGAIKLILGAPADSIKPPKIDSTETPTEEKFKLDSALIPVDHSSITIDKYGRLSATPALTDELRDEIRALIREVLEDS